MGMGYKNAKALKGGVLAWKEAEYSFQDENKGGEMGGRKRDEERLYRAANRKEFYEL